MRLLVLTDAGREECVCNVRLTGLPPGPAPPSLLVRSYSKAPPPARTGFLHPLAEEDAQPFDRFRRYLLERKKMAVASAPSLDLLLAAGSEAGSMAVTVVATSGAAALSSEALSDTQRFELRLRARLEAFSDPSFAGPLVLEPMARDARFIAHDVVEQWAAGQRVALVSQSLGDDDERHVEVFRAGSEPPPPLTVADTRAVVSSVPCAYHT